MDVIHRALQNYTNAVQKEASDHNVVVAGLTFILSDGQEHHAMYSTLKDGNAILSFISGSAEKNYPSPAGYKFVATSDTYKPSDLLEAFGERVDLYPSPSLSSLPKNFYENWRNGQTE